MDRLAHETVAGLHLISRDSQVDVHISGYQDNESIPVSWNAYAGTFVDLYIAIQARCLALGVGNFAVLAVQISGSRCVLQYIPRTGQMAHK